MSEKTALSITSKVMLMAAGLFLPYIAKADPLNGGLNGIFTILCLLLASFILMFATPFVALVKKTFTPLLLILNLIVQFFLVCQWYDIFSRQRLHPSSTKEFFKFLFEEGEGYKRGSITPLCMTIYVVYWVVVVLIIVSRRLYRYYASPNVNENS